MALIRIDPASAEYRQFSRLYQAARALRPSEIDRWNGELYATVGEGRNWGSFHPAGYFKLSQELVFDRLGRQVAPDKQVQALVTILHEANHARVEVDAPDEPNAVRSRHSKALDEGLTEWVSIDSVATFSERTGYGELPDPNVEYPAAYAATQSLLEYAAEPDGVAQLARRAHDAPVVMRWDVIADEIVKNKLGDLVPPDPGHQQAARAELINAMTQLPGWKHLDEARPEFGEVVARDTSAALDQAIQRIQSHYAEGTGQPYPAAIPNEMIARQQAGPAHGGTSLGGARERVISRGGEAGLRSLPPPVAANRVERPRQGAHPGGRQDEVRPAAGGPRAWRAAGVQGRSGTDRAAGEPARFLTGPAPAAGATHARPSLGDGSRGAGGPEVRPGRRGAGRETAPSRGKE